MELRQLRYLIAIADTGSFTTAAETVFVSQSALSQQIQLLEEEVGITLLDRSKRGARLTAAGEILSRHAHHALYELEQATVAMRELAGLDRGELRVGVVQTVNAYFIPSVVAEFSLRHPNIKLQIDELPTDDIETLLDNGALQVGIGFSPPTQPHIDSQVLFQEQLALIVRADHPLAGEAAIPVAALQDMAVILLAKTFCTRRLWEESAQLAGVQPKVVMEINTVASILSLVARTGLPTILPQQALADDAAHELVAIPLQDPTPTRQVSLLWHRHHFRCAATSAFLHLAEAAAQEL